jgi:5'-3' exonuclease
MNLHVIDGTYELYRSYYGAPKASNTAGREIGAARGLLRSLLALLREPDVTHMAIAFDHVIESFRNDLFEGYKTGEGIEPELWQQFELAEHVARAAGLVVWPMVEFEADDALATAAARWGADRKVARVFICSADKDLAQCVSGERIVLFDRMREKIIDEDGVHEKWGVGPNSIPDLLALMGDSADGIPGIARWGQKSSSTLLAEYESIEEIPEDPEEWSVKVRGAKSLADNLNAERAAALLYKDLATLRTDVPLKESLEDLEWRGAIREDLEPLAEEISATNTLERIKKWRD